MITVISASNRKGNLTSLFAKRCQQVLIEKKQEVQLLFLDQLPEVSDLKSLYDFQTSVFSEIGEQYIRPIEKFLFVIPEYNGSFPGILKLFIDGIHPENFRKKKAALIGVASGRAGNLRGMDHFSDILNHLQVHVMPQKLPISGMNGLLNKNEIVDAATLKLLEEQLVKLIEF